MCDSIRFDFERAREEKQLRVRSSNGLVPHLTKMQAVLALIAIGRRATRTLVHSR